jgi:RNA polymerase II-associated factor 1
MSASTKNNNNNKKQVKEKPQDKKASEFLCKVKYYNNLPDIPLEPKLLRYPFDPSRFYKYAATTLEKNFKHSIHTEPDLGIQIDLIENSVYRPPATRK